MGTEPHRVYILLGSNIAPQENIPKAVALLRQYGPIEAISTTWENPPVGASGPNFYNTAVLFRSNLAPDELKTDVLRVIEKNLGRVRTSDKNAPRTIDLDILIYDEELLEPGLWSEAFMAVPLAELRPHYRNPQNEETLDHFAQRLLNDRTFIPHPEIIP